MSREGVYSQRSSINVQPNPFSSGKSIALENTWNQYPPKDFKPKKRAIQGSIGLEVPPRVDVFIGKTGSLVAV